MDENGERKTRKNRAPSLLLILLWHHFCFYKRHRFLLVATLFMPFVLLTGLNVLIFEFSSTSTSDRRLGAIQKFLPCLQQTKPFISSGPYHYSSLYDCRTTPPSYATIQDCQSSGYACSYPSGQCVNESIYTDESLADHRPFCPLSTTSVRASGTDQPIRREGSEPPSTTFPSNIPTARMTTQAFFSSAYSSQCRCSNLNIGQSTYDRCSWLRGHIVYYPNTSRPVQQIMDLIKSEIDSYGRALNQIYLGSLSDTEFRKEADTLPLFDFQQMIKFAQCFEPANDRILGFRTRDEMLLHVKYLNDSLDPFDTPSQNNWPSRILWAAVNFDQISPQSISDQLPKQIKYSILRENKFTMGDDTTKVIALQDLIESSILKLKLNTTTLPLVPMMKELPAKCWIRPNWIAHQVLGLILPLVVVYSFIFAPINFLEQVITEKQLKLREYLSITGVSDLTLKLSWILFYLIFIVPASIGVAIYVHFFFGDPMISTDLSILIIQFLLYNLSQLFLSYFLSSFLKEPKRVSFILTFCNAVPSAFAVCAYHFSGNQLKGALLIVFRIASLHCSVPFVLSICYVVNWETFWIGGKWSNFFNSPSLNDGYHGFGEGILWMVGDSILYLIGAWYLQQVMPGEYGVKRKWYFFVQPSYWMAGQFKKPLSGGDAGTEMSQFKPDLEPRPINDDRKPTLVIDQLTKFYNRHKMGVDRLSLSIYQNEITSLLGQNGAGKSTTMNTLVGLLSATSGRFTVTGLDSTTQMDKIKKVLGFVPQYDILYPSMNVEEHIQFFGWLKGLDIKEINSTIYPLLDKFGMSHLKKTMTTNLSGGQKRKLSILTAYLGDPELVILDEPTTGVDPFSRRSIWDVLLFHRFHTATIVSTHFMDEADLLSDRIAVISEGKLRCMGTPMYLKQKYGQGYRIIAACTDDQISIERTKDFFTDQSQSQKINIDLTQINGRDLIFTLPKEYARSNRMIDLLKSIEDSRHDIGISSFGISEPTLEEAFFAAAQVDVSRTNAQPKDHLANRVITDRSQLGSAKLKYKNRLGIGLWICQFYELVKKRLILTKRSPSGLAMQILLPLAFIIILLLVSNAIAESKTAQMYPIHIYESYRQNVLFFQDKRPGDKVSQASASPSSALHPIFQKLVTLGLGPRCPSGLDGFKCDQSIITQPLINDRPDLTLSVDHSACSDCKTYCPEGNARQMPHWIAPSSDLIYRLPSSISAIDWVLAANQSDHWVTGGFQLHASNIDLSNSKGNLSQEMAKSTPWEYVVIWSKPNSKMAMLNAFYNLIMQTYSNDPTMTIQLSYEDFHFPSPEDDHPTKVNASNIINTFVGSYLMILAFTYATFGIAVSIQQEKTANLKELQYVSGAKPSAYWLANFAWDFVQYMLTMAVLMFFMGVFDNGVKTYLGEFVNILIPYGMTAIGFIYLMSFKFKSATGVNKMITIWNVLSLISGPIICLFEYNNYRGQLACDAMKARGDTSSCKPDFGWALIVGYILRRIPYYYLADGCFLIGIVHAIGSVTVGPNSAQSDIDMYQWPMLGKRMLEGYLTATVYMIILLVMEYRNTGLGRGRRGRKRNDDGANTTPSATPQDPDVREEERRVLQNETVGAPVVVKQVTKRYPKSELPAVNSVSFSIPRSQCFGLLGINGAGKTSLFRIMTGFQTPTSGEALIEGKNVVSEKLMLASNISYCPQENTLFDELSIREHLNLFGAFRGIPRSNLTTMIEALIKEVGLEEHAHKLAKQLSGGNKRKLNFALALLDYKPVVFLDEPTSGMDPGARRRTWTCIQSAISRGCSVVLTSHSMDECEALCHRLVIMARGQICCIGSIQYLKDKFGNRYTVKIKLTNQTQGENRSKSIDEVKQFVARSLPYSCLLEEHGTMLQYEVGAGSNALRLSALFGVLSDLRRLYPTLIEDFTLSQVTLERVFVSMAQRQQDQTGNQAEPQQHKQESIDNQNHVADRRQNGAGMGPPPVEDRRGYDNEAFHMNGGSADGVHEGRKNGRMSIAHA